MTGERVPVDLAGIARQACESLAGLALERHVEIGFDAPGHPVVVIGHAALLDAAISNIIDNALRYSPAEEAVSVAVDAVGRVVIEDRGPGVSDALKMRIFDRFARGDTRTGDGAGIGLALARRIAELHGGVVYVEDRPGGGARFVLALGRAMPTTR